MRLCCAYAFWAASLDTPGVLLYDPVPNVFLLRLGDFSREPSHINLYQIGIENAAETRLNFDLRCIESLDSVFRMNRPAPLCEQRNSLCGSERQTKTPQELLACLDRLQALQLTNLVFEGFQCVALSAFGRA